MSPGGRSGECGQTQSPCVDNHARSLEQCDHCNSTGCSCGSVVVISSSEATVPLYEHGSKYGWGAMLPGKYYEATHCYAG